MITVQVPPAWRAHTGAAQVSVAATCVGELAQALAQQYPALQGWLFDGDGSLKRWVNVFVNGQDVRLLQGADTPISPADDVRIILAVAGG